MENNDLKKQMSGVLREMADDLELGWFEDDKIETLFYELEVAFRYYLGSVHGDGMKYLCLNTPLHTLQKLHQEWVEKRRQFSALLDNINSE